LVGSAILIALIALVCFLYIFGCFLLIDTTVLIIGLTLFEGFKGRFDFFLRVRIGLLKRHKIIAVGVALAVFDIFLIGYGSAD
jgi:hypothetical protein